MTKEPPCNTLQRLTGRRPTSYGMPQQTISRPIDKMTHLLFCTSRYIICHFKSSRSPLASYISRPHKNHSPHANCYKLLFSLEELSSFCRCHCWHIPVFKFVLIVSYCGFEFEFFDVSSKLNNATKCDPVYPSGQPSIGTPHPFSFISSFCVFSF